MQEPFSRDPSLYIIPTLGTTSMNLTYIGLFGAFGIWGKREGLEGHDVAKAHPWSLIIPSTLDPKDL